MSRIPSCAPRPLIALLVATGILAAGTASAAASVGSIQFTAGTKNLTTDWYTGPPKVGAPGDTLDAGRPWQPAVGAELTWGRQGWPVLIALDVMHSYDDGMQRFPFISLGPLVIPRADVWRRARVIEVGLGVRRSVEIKGFSPYLGAGGSWVRASVAYQMIDPTQGQFGTPGASLGGTDTGIGYWAGGGIYRRIGPRFQMGVAARYSKATVTLPEPTVVGENGGYVFGGGVRDVQAGGRHIGLVLGWSFPSRE